MEILSVKNLSFKYPDAHQYALKDISLSIYRGDFLLLCGKSGYGKSTLLRLLKPEIAPFGDKDGEILFNNKNIYDLTKIDSAKKIGFVMQYPEEQIVSDKVWHELAFTLENLGYKSDEIRLKIAEIASYFGIDKWLSLAISELSGGQKQVLALASAMISSPELIILDEPTAQLDPIATENLINMLVKINRQLGTTIIIAEHSLDNLYQHATKVLFLQDSKESHFGEPQEVARLIAQSDFFDALPTPSKIYFRTITSQNEQIVPFSTSVCRSYLHSLNPISCIQNNKITFESINIKREPIISLKNVMFKYHKDSSDILDDFSLDIYKGEFFCLLGSNGSGKTTALNVMSGASKTYAGSVKILNKPIKSYQGNSLYSGLVSVLPQNPSFLFVKSSIYDDYKYYCKAIGLDEIETERRIGSVVDLLKIKEYLTRHPLDLSGGERQKVALGKILLSDPKIIILDEPTKGIDFVDRQEIGKLLKSFTNKGVTIVVVTHDIEFAAEFADRCALLCRGSIAATGYTRDFFKSLDFYTTSARKISKGIIENCVTCDDVVNAILGGDKCE